MLLQEQSLRMNVINGTSILKFQDLMLKNLLDTFQPGGSDETYTFEMIPESILNWPGNGNSYQDQFFALHFLIKMEMVIIVL